MDLTDLKNVSDHDLLIFIYAEVKAFGPSQSKQDERLDRLDERSRELEGKLDERIRPLERRVWALPSVATLIALAGLIVALMESIAK